MLAGAASPEASFQEPSRPSLTDNLNRALLTSFMTRLTDGDPSTTPFLAANAAATVAEDMEDPLASKEWEDAEHEDSEEEGVSSPPMVAEASHPEDVDDFPCVFRVVESRAAIRSSPYASSAVPRELSEINSPEDLARLMQIFRAGGLPETEEESDASESEKA